MTDDTDLTLRCAPAVVWVKEADGTLVVNPEKGSSRWLLGTEQAIWDLLTLGYPLEGVTQFVSTLLGVSSEAARRTVLGTCLEWETAGLLRVEGVTGHG